MMLKWFHFLYKTNKINLRCVKECEIAQFCDYSGQDESNDC